MTYKIPKLGVLRKALAAADADMAQRYGGEPMFLGPLMVQPGYAYISAARRHWDTAYDKRGKPITYPYRAWKQFPAALKRYHYSDVHFPTVELRRDYYDDDTAAYIHAGYQMLVSPMLLLSVDDGTGSEYAWDGDQWAYLRDDSIFDLIWTVPDEGITN